MDCRLLLGERARQNDLGALFPRPLDLNVRLVGPGALRGSPTKWASRARTGPTTGVVLSVALVYQVGINHALTPFRDLCSHGPIENWAIVDG